jgi:hypothetical protein
VEHVVRVAIDGDIVDELRVRSVSSHHHDDGG